jgi:hypothetical protein
MSASETTAAAAFLLKVNATVYAHAGVCVYVGRATVYRALPIM